MLNPFPELLTYGLVGPLLIRLALGIFFVLLGYDKLRNGKEHLEGFFESLSLKPVRYYVKGLGIIETVAGVLLMAGLITQIAAIIVSIILIVSIVVSFRKPEANLKSPLVYALLLVMALSLITTGAGFLAVDLPL